jgi:hypothetical protein
MGLFLFARKSPLVELQSTLESLMSAEDDGSDLTVGLLSAYHLGSADISPTN